MTLDEIKNLIKADGGKFIIVENGEPVLMIMGFEDYKKMIGNPEREIPEAQKSQEFNSESDSESDNEYTEAVERTPQSEESLKIEDLPV